MSFDGSETDPRVVVVRQAQQKRLVRFFLLFALIEGAAIAAIVFLTLVFQVIDPDLFLPLLIGTVIVAGVVLCVSIVTIIRSSQRQIHEITGTPLSGSGDGRR